MSAIIQLMIKIEQHAEEGPEGKTLVNKIEGNEFTIDEILNRQLGFPPGTRSRQVEVRMTFDPTNTPTGFQNIFNLLKDEVSMSTDEITAISKVQERFPDGHDLDLPTAGNLTPQKPE